ncbi:hypothetical protein [Actinocrispum wychmicini]|uniref:Uncharacterized protein n=1 Tax=Actinocrispum wychmicini TaxID=1213861 RepID=A0A4R2JJV7_9PSEU|nr:hypothetical protein [Actinocrispum wychmicini]TCO59424.1 hypothetical protein EV192_104266 [Actinocrispum wychmicini]
MSQWTEYVQAVRLLARARAAVLHTPERAEWLSQALTSSDGWERSAGLEFLITFPDDLPALLDQLFPLAISHKTGPAAWEVLRRASKHGLVDEGRLSELVWSELDADDVTEFEYNCVYSLLDIPDARTLLAAVGQRALASLDPEIRKTGKSIQEHRDTHPTTT